MGEEIFRKKSLDKAKSPENLDDYIRVASPSIWLLLISAIVLLTGACVWGTFGHIDRTVPSDVRVENGNSICYIAEEDISSVQVGLTVKFADFEAVITEIGEKEKEGYVCTLSTNDSINKGLYQGKVVIDRARPLSFILN